MCFVSITTWATYGLQWMTAFQPALKAPHFEQAFSPEVNMLVHLGLISNPGSSHRLPVKADSWEARATAQVIVVPEPTQETRISVPVAGSGTDHSVHLGG